MTSIGNLRPYDPMVDDIQIWIRAFKSFLLANNLSVSVKAEAQEGTSAGEKTTDKKCVAVLLSTIGLPIVSTLSSLVSPKNPEDLELQTLLDMLEAHYKPHPKALSERFRFMGRRQQQGESVNEFLADLRKLAATCKFEADLDNRLRDQFVFGLKSEAAQKQLFTKPDDIKLKDVIAVAIAQELSEQSLSVIRGTAPSKSDEVHKVKFKGNHPPQQQQKHQNKSSKAPSNKSSSNKECWRCGSKQHQQHACPHKKVKCYNCNELGHFASRCNKNKQRQKSEDEDDKSHTHNVKRMEVHSIHKKRDDSIWVTVLINGKSHEMEFDTGCQKSLLSEQFWREGLGAPVMRKNTDNFTTYTHEKFSALGDIPCKIEHNGQVVDHVFPVVKGQSLFGRDILKKLIVDWTAIAEQIKVKKVNSSDSSKDLKNLLLEFKDRFSEPKGRIHHFKARIVLKEDAVPKFLKARTIPYAYREKVNLELQAMEKAGIIEKIDHSEWASPLVVVPKPNGKVRITGDFKDTVNAQLHVTQYPIAHPEDLFHDVSECVKFSKLDGNNAYHQLEVEEECKKFLVINTPRGLYRYNVLPQGISSSPALFQEFADKMLSGINHTGSYIDDALTGGINDQEHLKTLRVIFERMRKFNYYVSRDKCEFMKEKIEFLGHILTHKCIHASPKKIEAVQAIAPPKSKKEVQSFLGFVNFYCKFVPHLSDMCKPLSRLTGDSVEWKWGKACQEAFECVKQALIRSPILTNFDPSKQVGISCDASSQGVGYVLFHRVKENDKYVEKAIAYGSRVLSPSEENYSQIEKEGLAIICGLRKFYKYLCGRKFILVTDHKPLVAIFGSKTNLPAFVAARLHRWSLELSQFDYTIEYRKTDEHGNADALSRIPMITKEVNDEHSHEVKLIAAEGLQQLPVTTKVIRDAMKKDKVMNQVIQYLHSSWPSKVPEEQPEVKAYYSRKEELSMHNGILIWATRVVIPMTLRTRILESLHETHAGIVRMKSLARMHVWWPHIDKDIESMAKSCIDCCSRRDDPPSAPLHPWSFPERPWQRLHIDLAGPLYGRMYLVVVDSHSKWPEVYDMKNDTTSVKVIEKLRDSFVRFGIPEQIVSDNGRQFISGEFKQFCKNNGIRHITSSAYHPRTNGEAERFVQTFKKSMNEQKVELTFRLQRFLLNYRVTPHATTGVSPSELLIGRQPRTLMDLVRPEVKATVAKSQLRQEKNYNSRVRSRLFVEGEEVWVKTYSKNKAKWSLGQIEKQIGPVTYQVKVDGQIYKRHVDQIYAASKLCVGRPKDKQSQEKDDQVQVEPMLLVSPGKQRSLSAPQPPSSSPEVFEDAAEDVFVSMPASPVKPSSPVVPHRPKRNRKPVIKYGSVPE